MVARGERTRFIQPHTPPLVGGALGGVKMSPEAPGRSVGGLAAQGRGHALALGHRTHRYIPGKVDIPIMRILLYTGKGGVGMMTVAADHLHAWRCPHHGGHWDISHGPARRSAAIRARRGIT